MMKGYFVYVLPHYQVVITCTSNAIDWQFVKITGFERKIDVTFSGRGEGYPMTAPGVGTTLICSTGEFQSKYDSLQFTFSYAKIDRSRQDLSKGGNQLDPTRILGPEPNTLDTVVGSITLISSENEGGDHDNNDSVCQITWFKTPQSVEEVAAAARAAVAAVTNPNVIEGVENYKIAKGIEGLFG